MHPWIRHPLYTRCEARYYDQKLTALKKDFKNKEFAACDNLGDTDIGQQSTASVRHT